MLYEWYEYNENRNKDMPTTESCEVPKSKSISRETNTAEADFD